MNRRHFLSTAGTVAAAIGGTTGVVTATDSSTARQQGEEFVIESHDAPARTRIGDEYQFSLPVRNVTDEDRTLESDLLMTTEDADDWFTVGTITLDVPAGETATFESDTMTFEYTGWVLFQVSDLFLWAVQIVRADYVFGEMHESPDGISITVDAVDFREEYEYEEIGGNRETTSAIPGLQYAFVVLRTENLSDSVQSIPERWEFDLFGPDYRYEWVRIDRREGRYSGNEVAPGSVQEGWIAYNVPADLGMDDIGVQWEKGSETDHVALWTAEEETEC